MNLLEQTANCPVQEYVHCIVLDEDIHGFRWLQCFAFLVLIKIGLCWCRVRLFEGNGDTTPIMWTDHHEENKYFLVPESLKFAVKSE
jgi:hypothetical protein